MPTVALNRILQQKLTLPTLILGIHALAENHSRVALWCCHRLRNDLDGDVKPYYTIPCGAVVILAYTIVVNYQFSQNAAM